ncbi:MAG: YceD family protein [Thermostichales cyanobacterium BF4_bins_65]
MLRAIPIKELLKLPRQTVLMEFCQGIPDFESLTPVQGWVKLTHRGQFLQAWGEASTIVTLTCHRCLQQFNHRLHTQFEEILWLEGTPEDDLMETLDPQGSFDTTDWVYQHLCLALPQRQACRPECQPPILTTPAPETGDPRWAILKQWLT